MKKSRPPEWPHQKEGRLFLKARAGKGAGLGFPPGEGKTRPTIRRIQTLHKQGEANLVLIVNTLSGMHVWVENWHAYADTPALFVDLREHGSAGIRTAQTLAQRGNLVVCLVNYETAWKIGYQYVTETKKASAAGQQKRKVLKAFDTTLHDVDWDVAVLDEIQKISSPDSVVSKFFRTKVAPRCKERLALTGSLITKNPSKAWAPIKFLTGDEVFPGSYSGRPGFDAVGNPRAASFLSRYAIMNPYIPGAIEGWHNLDDFAQKVARCFFTPDPKHLKQREAVHVYRRIPLSPKSRRVYDKLTKDLFVELQEWEAEGRKEYGRLIDYVQELWKERVASTGGVVDSKASYWRLPDDAFFRPDIERDFERYVSSVFAEGVVSLTKVDLVARLRKRAMTVDTVTIEHVFAVMRKQQQITAGFIVPDPPEDDPERTMEPTPLGTEKIDTMLEELEKYWVDPPSKPSPVVVVVTGNYEQAQVVKAIEKRFRFTPKVLDGAVKGAQKRHDMIAAAKHDPVFVLKAQVGAESIDCQWAEAFILMSKTPNTVQYEQLLARMLRGERTRGTYIHIVAERTVDERIEEILRGDLDLARKVGRDWRSAIVVDKTK